MDYLRTVEWITPIDRLPSDDNKVLMYFEGIHRYGIGWYWAPQKEEEFRSGLPDQNQETFEACKNLMRTEYEWVPEEPTLYTSIPSSPLKDESGWYRTTEVLLPKDIDVLMWFNIRKRYPMELYKQDFRIGNVWDIHDEIPDYWMYLPHKDCIKRGPLDK